MPVGIFSSDTKHQSKINSFLDIDSKKFAAFLYNEWQAIPDAISAKEASKLIGYACSTIIDQINKKQIKAILYHCSYLIPKDALIILSGIQRKLQHLSKVRKALDAD